MNELQSLNLEFNFPGLGQVVLALLVSLLLAQVVAWVYRRTYEGMSFSTSFVHALVLASLVGCMLIMAIGSNLAAGLGMLGTLSIIRFRTQLRDPRDIIFMFATIAIGIATGSGAWSIAAVGTAMFCLAVFYLQWAPATAMRKFEGLLRYTLPADAEDSRIQDVLDDFCEDVELIAVRESEQGNQSEFAYQVRLRQANRNGELVDRLSGIGTASNVQFTMQRFNVGL
jgi:uncharacterized membrane protein YhiD involved in acid resistance